MYRRLRILLLFLGVALMLPASLPAQAAAVMRAGTWRVVAPHRPDPLFHEAGGVAVDRWRNLYIADPVEGRVIKLSPAGRLLARWAAAGLPAPYPDTAYAGIAVDARGTIYVLNGGVIKLSPGGQVLARWSLPMERTATGIAVGGSGNVFVLSLEAVSNGGNARIDKISPAGTILGTWRTPLLTTSEDYHQVYPNGIVVGPGGDVYVSVATMFGHRPGYATTVAVYRFPSAGIFSETILPRGGVFGPVIAVDGSGAIYMAITISRSTVIKVSPGGVVLARFGSYDGTIRATRDAWGRIYVADVHDAGQEAWSTSGIVHVLSPAGKELARWGRLLRQPQFPLGLGIAVAPNGTIYVAGTSSGPIYTVLAPSGAVLRTVPNTKGLVGDPRSIAVDGRFNVYVADGVRDQIVKFSPAGVPMARWPVTRPGGSMLDGLTLDRPGNVYVSVSGHGQVVKLSPAGKLLATFGSPGTRPGQFGAPSGLAVDRAGDIYVADTFNNRIQKLAPNGRVLLTWGDATVFDRPIRIALDPSGNVYVADLTHPRIEKFTGDGKRIGVLGEPGIWPGQLREVTGLAFDARGRLYVLDAGNNRVDQFSS